MASRRKNGIDQISANRGLTLKIGGSKNCSDPYSNYQQCQEINETNFIHKNKLSDAAIFVKTTS